MDIMDMIYEDLKDKKKSFFEIVEFYKSVKGYQPKDIGQFYSSLTLDGRFINDENNCWDLKEKHKLSEVINNVEEIEDEEDIFDKDYEEEDIDEEDEDNEDDIPTKRVKDMIRKTANQFTDEDEEEE